MFDDVFNTNVPYGNLLRKALLMMKINLLAIVIVGVREEQQKYLN